MSARQLVTSFNSLWISRAFAPAAAFGSRVRLCRGSPLGALWWGFERAHVTQWPLIEVRKSALIRSWQKTNLGRSARQTVRRDECVNRHLTLCVMGDSEVHEEVQQPPAGEVCPEAKAPCEPLLEKYPEHLVALASFRKFIHRIESAWPRFLNERRGHLMQAERNGAAPEKVAEDILSDFFTIALDWSNSDFNNQLNRADLVLTTLGIKRLLVEAKRPESLKRNTPNLNKALDQAWKYADEQRVKTIAISDGYIFYAVDIVDGGLKKRVDLNLDDPVFSPNCWWVSIDGIYRSVENLDHAGIKGPAAWQSEAVPIGDSDPAPFVGLVHPKYKVPARCFAYIGDASNTATWKLPYRLANGAVDEKHLPGAIRAVVCNYRGARVKSIPEKSLPDVLVRLGKAAAEIGKLPDRGAKPHLSYQLLHEVLQQLGRLEEIFQNPTEV